MHLGVASTRLSVSCTYGLYVARRRHNALCWKAHGDRSADADVALQIERTAVHLDQRLCQRQAETGVVVAAVELAVDLAELGQAFGMSSRAMPMPVSTTWNVGSTSAGPRANDFRPVG